VFHHEPIWQRPLHAEHTEIFTLMRYVSPAVYSHAKMTDHFGAVLGAGEQFYRNRYTSWVASLKP